MSNSLFTCKEVRNRVKPFNYILSRSFYRPRDIIVYFNNLFDIHDSSSNSLYTRENLYAAEKLNSENMRRELLDEWMTIKPEIETYLSILQNIETMTFYFERFKSEYLKKYQNHDKCEIDNTIKFLFENSIIGQKKSIYWEYVCQKSLLEINWDKEFKTHPSLKHILALKGR